MYSRFVNIYDSSNVSNIAFSPSTQELIVTFVNKDGTHVKYHYRHVALELFGAVVSAESVGTTFRALISSKFKGTKL